MIEYLTEPVMDEAERLRNYKDAVRDLVFARDRLARAEHAGEGVREAAERESDCIMRLINLGDGWR